MQLIRNTANLGGDVGAQCHEGINTLDHRKVKYPKRLSHVNCLPMG